MNVSNDGTKPKKRKKEKKKKRKKEKKDLGTHHPHTHTPLVPTAAAVASQQQTRPGDPDL